MHMLSNPDLAICRCHRQEAPRHSCAPRSRPGQRANVSARHAYFPVLLRADLPGHCPHQGFTLLRLRRNAFHAQPIGAGHRHAGSCDGRGSVGAGAVQVTRREDARRVSAGHGQMIVTAPLYRVGAWGWVVRPEMVHYSNVRQRI